MISVVIADDASDIRLLLSTVLSIEGNFTVVGEARSADEALQLVEDHKPDVIVCDHSFDSTKTGIDIAPVVKLVSPETKFILFSAYDSLQKAISQTPAIDSFVLKTDVARLPEVIKQLCT